MTFAHSSTAPPVAPRPPPPTGWTRRGSPPTRRPRARGYRDPAPRGDDDRRGMNVIGVEALPVGWFRTSSETADDRKRRAARHRQVERAPIWLWPRGGRSDSAAAGSSPCNADHARNYPNAGTRRVLRGVPIRDTRIMKQGDMLMTNWNRMRGANVDSYGSGDALARPADSHAASGGGMEDDPGGSGIPVSGVERGRLTSEETAVCGSKSTRPQDAAPSANGTEPPPEWEEREDRSVIELAEAARRILEHGPSATDPVWVLTGGDTKVFEELLYGRTPSKMRAVKAVARRRSQ